MKHKKFSSAILCGFKEVGGRQQLGTFSDGASDARCPRAVCVLGAISLCLNGDAESMGYGDFPQLFADAWGIAPQDLNDEGMPWEHLYGMARAAGL